MFVFTRNEYKSMSFKKFLNLTDGDIDTALSGSVIKICYGAIFFINDYTIGGDLNNDCICAYCR